MQIDVNFAGGEGLRPGAERMVQGVRDVTHDTYGQVFDSTLYSYSSSPGSSKLLSYTGMAKNMTYDLLGNLTSDNAHGVYLLDYDYRNLLTHSHSSPNISGGVQTDLVCLYDESERRIKKGYSYNYWSTCGPEELGIGDGELLMSLSDGSVDSLGGDTIAPVYLPQDSQTLGDTLLFGGGLESVGMQTDGTTPPGGEPCLLVASAATFYLYDGGVLAATFDQNDNVIDMFVNGPNGRIASYYQNNTSYLYYFISDQLGSTRVVMKGTPPDTTYPYAVAEYYNYYPFGQVAEQSGNYPTSFQWTSKEHDQQLYIQTYIKEPSI